MAGVGGRDFRGFDRVIGTSDGQRGTCNQRSGIAGNGAFDLDGEFLSIHIDLDDVSVFIHGLSGLGGGTEFDGGDDETRDCALVGGSAEIDGARHGCCPFLVCFFCYNDGANPPMKNR